MSYYKDISEINLYNWEKCIGGKIKYCRKDISKGSKKKDLKAWDRVYDSFINRYGINSNYRYLLDLKTELALLQCDFVITGDRFLLNKINVVIESINEVVKTSNYDSMDIDTLLVVASKWMGFGMNKTETSVSFLYDTLDNIKKEAQELTKKNKNKA